MAPRAKPSATDARPAFRGIAHRAQQQLRAARAAKAERQREREFKSILMQLPESDDSMFGYRIVMEEVLNDAMHYFTSKEPNFLLADNVERFHRKRCELARARVRAYHAHLRRTGRGAEAARQGCKVSSEVCV